MRLKPTQYGHSSGNLDGHSFNDFHATLPVIYMANTMTTIEQVSLIKMAGSVALSTGPRRLGQLPAQPWGHASLSRQPTEPTKVSQLHCNVLSKSVHCMVRIIGRQLTLHS